MCWLVAWFVGCKKCHEKLKVNSSYPLGKFRRYPNYIIYPKINKKIVNNEISTAFSREFNLKIRYLSLILMMFRIGECK